MGKFLDFIMDYSLGRRTCNNLLNFRKKYRKEAMEEYESTTLYGWINERAEADLNPDDNVKKYKTDLKRWFLRVKEAYNTNFSWNGISLPKNEKEEWKKKLEITNNDFPLVYYIKESDKMNKDIGYEIFLDYHRNTAEYSRPIEFNLNQCPDPAFYKKIVNQKKVYGKHGYDKYGYDREGYDKRGYDRDGYDREGYGKDGYDKHGYNRNGYDREGYDRDGYDESGYDIDGYDSSGYDSDGYDSDGYPDPDDY